MLTPIIVQSAKLLKLESVVVLVQYFNKNIYPVVLADRILNENKGFWPSHFTNRT